MGPWMAFSLSCSWRIFLGDVTEKLCHFAGESLMLLVVSHCRGLLRPWVLVVPHPTVEGFWTWQTTFSQNRFWVDQSQLWHSFSIVLCIDRVAIASAVTSIKQRMLLTASFQPFWISLCRESKCGQEVCRVCTKWLEKMSHRLPRNVLYPHGDTLGSISKDKSKIPATLKIQNEVRNDARFACCVENA